MPSPTPESPDAARRPPPSARRTGRRVAIGGFWAVTVAVAVASAFQVSQQVLFNPCPGGLSCSGAPAASFTSCREGLLALHSAVERARLAAAGTDGEDAALARFRAALTPEWGHRDDVAAACHASADDEGALDAIERLRYAEEHAVRREAGELAPLRRRVEAIVDRELSRPALQAPAPGPTAHPTLANPP
ncbi:MAG: hypothetical protein ABJE95_21870 [Byssovorax sp.]